MPKNIVLCLDGTHNQIEGVNTNVWRIYSALEKGPEQLTFYHPGVGTLFDRSAATGLRRLFLYALDLTTGTTLRDGFSTAYIFLMRHYEPGDRIYLFGFSRGSYTARAVAGAIHLFGLLERENEHLVPYLWQTYSNDLLGAKKRDSSRVTPTSEAAALTPGEEGSLEGNALFDTVEKFRAELSRSDSVPFAFLGLWDSVSAYGVVPRFRTLPNTRANPSVKVVRHAVAVDERRSFFRLNRFDHKVPGQDLREVWFAGYHSDVGGGIAPPENGLGSISLGWMLREAKGLRFHGPTVAKLLSDPKPDPLAPVHNSMDFKIGFLEFWPVRTWNPKRLRYTWHWPNFFRPRHIPRDAVAHISVKERRDAPGSGYAPKNLPPGIKFES